MNYTPKPGDYVRIANLSKAEYHQAAALFIAAGANIGEYPDDFECKHYPLFGWNQNAGYGLFHDNDGGAAFLGGTELILRNGNLVPADDLDPDLWQEVADLRRRVEALESNGSEDGERPSGFYWVDLIGEWWPAFWDDEEREWDILFCDFPRGEDDLNEIGPRIEEPE